MDDETRAAMQQIIERLDALIEQSDAPRRPRAGAVSDDAAASFVRAEMERIRKVGAAAERLAKEARPTGTGYYWIMGDDEEPEPARWDAEAGLWFLIGLTEGLDPNAMTALGPVQGPSSW